MTDLIKAATQRQIEATHPRHSVWVSANAGTGKTRVLTQRFLSLLLHDKTLKPDEILAITYTRAAAREMVNRIRESLMSWATDADDVLQEKLSELIADGSVSPEHMVRARTLFADVLDAPLGLNVLTIHAFCQKLLQRFPLEANVSPSFSVIEGRDEQRLRQESFNETFRLLAEDKNTFFAFFTARVSESSLRKACVDFIESPARYARLFRHHGGIEETLADVAYNLNVQQGFLPENEHEYFINDIIGVIDRADLTEIISYMEKGKSHAQNRARALSDFLENSDWSRLSYVFYDSKGELRAPEKIADKDSLVLGGQQLLGLLENTTQQFLDADKKRCQMATYLKTAAYLTVGAKALDVYEKQKKKQGVLDFNDLIMLANKLLLNKESAACVQYRLDTNVKHALLDEGQDIDADQWGLIQAIVDEFYDGKGQHEKSRTFFAVGDLKQSIFRFRGAMPDVFGGIPEYLDQKAGNNSKKVDLITSFRSSHAILNVADQVFESEARKKAVVGDEAVENHIAAFSGKPGWVEVWPLDEAFKKEKESEEWKVPEYAVPTPTAHALIAEKVATSIERLLNSRTLVTKNDKESTGSPVQPSDIMVLLHNRGGIMGELIRAFNKKGLPHTGADKSDLRDEPIVQDLLALSRFLLTPKDDLALAQVLRSPLFGLDDAALYTIYEAKSRNQSLWSCIYGNFEALQLQNIKNVLVELLSMVDFEAPYEIYSKALQITQAKGRYLCRFTPNKNSAPLRIVSDVFDTFLNAALDHGAGLSSFVHQFETYGSQLKRIPDEKDNAIRILTAHGSKGLEAPIVYMPDTTRNFYSTLSNPLMTHAFWNKEETLCLYHVPNHEKTALQKKLIAEEKSKIFGDEMRLLYVALTRAKERLYIGGAQPVRYKAEECWYGHIQEVVAKAEGWVDYEENRVWHHPAERDIRLEEGTVEPMQNVVPTWAKNAAKEEKKDEITRPSEGIKIEQRLLKNQNEKMFTKGRLAHRLLEILPSMPDEARMDHAANFLTNNNLEPSERDTILEMIESTFHKFPELFLAESRAEVSVITQDEKKTVEGIVDRLVIKDDEVWVVDYKTNTKVPNEVPTAYKNQLGHYKTILASVFPQKVVKTAVLWTAARDKKGKFNPRLDWV